MNRPARITLDAWDERYAALCAEGLREGEYGGSLRRHLCDGDRRLEKIVLDDSAASLRLWNFLLTEEERLHRAKANGHCIVGTMKDLGTVPVMAYAFNRVTAFYPDGAWWLPCVMENQTGLLEIADSLGIDESFCPVRAMLGAFVGKEHFPIPDFLTCSVGATCDDFTAIAQRLESLGHSIFWWEMPHRRRPAPGEETVELPGGYVAPRCQVDFVRGELEKIKKALEKLTGQRLDEEKLADGIQKANRVRSILAELRRLGYTADLCPLPALEMLIAEMLSIHFCSDRAEAEGVLQELLEETRRRVENGIGILPKNAVRVFWFNPVADLRAMNLLEDAGGRVCGSDYMISHALDLIPENIPPMEALARSALADPMVGSARDRAERIVRDIKHFGAEAAVLSRIPGASHCSAEGAIIKQVIEKRCGIPVVDIEIPPLTDSFEPTLRTRLEALVETVLEKQR